MPTRKVHGNQPTIDSEILDDHSDLELGEDLSYLMPPTRNTAASSTTVTTTTEMQSLLQGMMGFMHHMKANQQQM